MKRVGKKVLAAAAATLRPVKQRKCGHTAARPGAGCKYCQKQDYYIKRRRKKLPGRKVALKPSEAASIIGSQRGPSTKKRICGHTASTSDPKCEDCQAADALLARVRAHLNRKRDPNFVPGSVPLGRKIKKHYHSGPCTPEALCSICWEREYNREWRASQGNPELLEHLRERAAQRQDALKELRRKRLNPRKLSQAELAHLNDLPRRQEELKERIEKRRNEHVEYAREQRRKRYQELVATPEGRDKIKKRNHEYYLRKKSMRERKAVNEGE